MRLLPILLLLPALAIGDDQKPLKEKATAWFDKFKSYIPSSAPLSPIDIGASKVAGLVVEEITSSNWRSKMLPMAGEPIQGPGEWMVLFSGNTSCYGRCEQTDKAFNKSITILAAGGSPPNMGHVDCDKENLLCTTWSTGIPEIWHFLISAPAGEQSRSSSSLHIVPIFPKNVTAQYIVDIHTKKTYLDIPEYTGAYHPIDGWLQQFGLLEPLGYVIWGFGTIPSWLFMVVISFFSRQLMARRTGGARPPAPSGTSAQ